MRPLANRREHFDADALPAQCAGAGREHQPDDGGRPGGLHLQKEVGLGLRLDARGNLRRNAHPFDQARIKVALIIDCAETGCDGACRINADEIERLVHSINDRYCASIVCNDRKSGALFVAPALGPGREETANAEGEAGWRNPIVWQAHSPDSPAASVADAIVGVEA